MSNSVLETMPHETRIKLTLLAADLVAWCGMLGQGQTITAAELQRNILELPPIEAAGLAEIFRTAGLLVQTIDLVRSGGTPPAAH